MAARSFGSQDDAGPTAPPPRPRGAALALMGALVLLLGLLCGLMAFVTLMAPALAAHAPKAPPADPAATAWAAAFFGGLAVAYVWLGIGSMLAQRWARTLLFITSAWWLVVGLVTAGMVPIMLPAMLASAPTRPGVDRATVAAVAGVAIAVIIGLFLIILPAAMILFYGSKGIRAACEARHPSPSWTDACPPSVLSLSLWSAFGALFCLPGALITTVQLPAFGMFLPVAATRVFYVVLAAISAWCAWGLYRLNRAAWWTLIGVQALVWTSWLVTMLVAGPDAWTRHMSTVARTPESAQIATMLARRMPWILSAMVVPYLAFAIWTGRHFRGRSQPPA